ncbi:PaaI family thioesterase [Natronomonas salina]|uniref:PaaI family thioesterase n=1 Tax=Natronomonas salina TaxID=1710540 RepID=UPI0015B530BB|nr:PaaI family thioesterase [Natronomonas salina]QLD90077.1 PaaI family thioesterase [Natronomonas salina]
MTDVNRRFLENHDHLRSLGIAIEAQSEGSVTLSLPFDESLANPGTGVMQGGVVATLIDHAGGAAIRTTLDEPDSTPHASTELNVSYVRPASDDLRAEATVIRSGSAMGVVDVEVTSEHEGERKTVAVGRVSLHLDRD